MAKYNIGGIKIPTLTYPRLLRYTEIYITTDFLDDYVEVLGLDSNWPIGVQVEEAKKEAAVYRAQIYVDSLNYQGAQYWSDQYLQWPRYPVTDKSGYVVRAEETPYDIFNAVAEGAFQEYKSPGVLQPIQTVDDIYPLQSSEVAAGSVSSKKSYDTSNKRPVTNTERLKRLQDYLRQWRVSTGTFVKLSRT